MSTRLYEVKKTLFFLTMSHSWLTVYAKPLRACSQLFKARAIQTTSCHKETGHKFCKLISVTGNYIEQLFTEVEVNIHHFHRH